MVPEIVPTTLDWVTERARCSPQRLFVLLAEVIDSDVKAVRDRKPQPNVEFTYARVNDSKVIVAKQEDWGKGIVNTTANVVFELTQTGIVVRRITAGSAGSEKQLFEARPALGVAGTCRLEVNGQPLELWQVSRKALEDLFFS